MTQNSSATSAPGASLLPDGIAALTTIHFVLIAVLAILVIAGIIWGTRQKRIRVQAEQDVVANAEEAGVAPVEPDARTPEPDTPPAPIPTPAAPIPTAPAPPPIAEPIAPVPLAPTPNLADGPVTQLKGLGPKVAARLAQAGVTTVGQIAALDEAAARSLDAQLGDFAGRMARDRWIEQARLLAAGDRAGFEAVFGKL